MPRASRADVARELARRDPALGKVIQRAGPVRLRAPNPDGVFGALVRSIVYQQLAGRAAHAIHTRVRALVDGPLTPEAVLALPDEALRGAGLSAAKLASIRDLAAKVAEDVVPLGRIRKMTDAEVVDHLTVVRGVGRWTVEMLLLFELRRPDVWPTGDLGVRVGYGLMHGSAEPPTAKELEPLGDIYRPHRSLAALYCWRAVDLARGA
jgi:DNA-3-methyladenine glycosylase II